VGQTFCAVRIKADYISVAVVVGGHHGKPPALSTVNKAAESSKSALLGINDKTC
jgi:hypothetical protein